MRFDRYLNYEELTGALKAFAAEHPGLCELVSVGKSREGRRIWLAEITNRQTGPAAEKPAFWVDGNTHAGEVTGSMCALYLIQTLLESHGEDDLITRLPPRRTDLLRPPPPLPRRRRALPDHPPYPASLHPPLARA